ncbi:MAG: STAS domain-containing protein [Spirochaetales bacterium]|nr:STAS domain-containing protein [Spirochaetales bacterium]
MAEHKAGGCEPVAGLRSAGRKPQSMMNDAILYGEADNDIFIRALGRVTVNICYELRDRIFTRLGDLPHVGNIYIDLSRCDYMDSTFMGIILGINKKLKNVTDTGLTLVCPTVECSNLFTALNIMRFFTVHEGLVSFPSTLETISSSHRPTPDFMLAAHDELAEVSSANADKFRILREILQKKVIEERRKATERGLEIEEETDEEPPPPSPTIVMSDD